MSIIISLFYFLCMLLLFLFFIFPFSIFLWACFIVFLDKGNEKLKYTTYTAWNYLEDFYPFPCIITKRWHLFKKCHREIIISLWHWKYTIRIFDK